MPTQPIPGARGPPGPPGENVRDDGVSAVVQESLLDADLLFF